jgi:hypothetical protein
MLTGGKPCCTEPTRMTFHARCNAGLFGQTQAAGAFGSTPAAGSSIFGGFGSSPSIFGGATAGSAPASPFGGTAAPFGQSAAAPAAGGLFGNTAGKTALQESLQNACYDDTTKTAPSAGSMPAWVQIACFGAPHDRGASQQRQVHCDWFAPAYAGAFGASSAPAFATGTSSFGSLGAFGAKPAGQSTPGFSTGIFGSTTGAAPSFGECILLTQLISHCSLLCCPLHWLSLCISSILINY